MLFDVSQDFVAEALVFGPGFYHGEQFIVQFHLFVGVGAGFLFAIALEEVREYWIRLRWYGAKRLLVCRLSSFE